MSQHAADHPGHAGYALEEDEPRQPFLLVHLEFGGKLLTGLWMLVARHEIHAPSEHPHGAQSDPIRPVGRLAVCNLHSPHLIFRVPDSLVSTCQGWMSVSQTLTLDVAMLNQHPSRPGLVVAGSIL